MKDILDDSSRQAIVLYRIEKSELALKEAQILADHNLYDSAVSRLYYACYYIASALLIANKIESSTHAGVKRMLSLNFIQPGMLEHKYLRTLSNLMQGRTMSDYEDFLYQDGESYKIYLEEAKDFVERLKHLIKE